jgi:excinuclease ABC subunit C
MASPMRLTSGIQPSLSPSGNPFMEHLRARVRVMPKEPGVYRWLDAKGNILYVGKAKNLRNRLRSYVAKTPKIEHFRKRALLENMAGLEVTFTSTDVEALILEMHLIRSLKPRYNIALTRDRHYVFIRIGVEETFPGVGMVHKKVHDGALYLGPYTNRWMQQQMFDLLRELYKFRDCGMRIDLAKESLFEEPGAVRIPLELTITHRDRRAPCLDFHIGKCSGPCEGSLTPGQYRTQSIDPVISFYRGDTSEVFDALMLKLKESKGDKKFENAARIRDILSYIGDMEFQKKLFDPNAPSMDAIGFDDDLKTAVVLQVRGGNLANEERIALTSVDEPADVLAQIIPQLYLSEADVPDYIAVPVIPRESRVINAWILKEFGKTVRIRQPKRGAQKRLMDLARTNALRLAL